MPKLPSKEKRDDGERKGRYWLSNICGATQVMSPGDDDYDDYKVGDWDKCLCGNLRCYATVTEGAPALEASGNGQR